MIYYTIKKDAEHNTHAKLILKEIHQYSDKYKEYTFVPGEITTTVLNKIKECILDDYSLPENVSCYEVKQLAKIYLRG